MQDQPSKAAPASGKPGRRPPEKRLFHKPLTVGKLIVYALLSLLAAALVLLGRFVYVTVIDAKAAFPDTPVVVSTPQATDAPPASPDAAQTPEPTQTLSPEEQLSLLADTDFMKASTTRRSAKAATTSAPTPS